MDELKGTEVKPELIRVDKLKSSGKRRRCMVRVSTRALEDLLGFPPDMRIFMIGLTEHDLAWNETFTLVLTGDNPALPEIEFGMVPPYGTLVMQKDDKGVISVKEIEVLGTHHVIEFPGKK